MERIGDDERKVHEAIAAAASFRHGPIGLGPELTDRLIESRPGVGGPSRGTDEVARAIWSTFYNAAVRHLCREGYGALVEHVDELGKAHVDASAEARLRSKVLPLLRARAGALAEWADQYGPDALVRSAGHGGQLPEEGRADLLQEAPPPTRVEPRRGRPRSGPPRVTAELEEAFVPLPTGDKAYVGGFGVPALGVYPGSDVDGFGSGRAVTVGMAVYLNDAALRQSEKAADNRAVRASLIYHRFRAAGDVAERYRVLGRVELVQVRAPDALAQIPARQDAASDSRRAYMLRSDGDFVLHEALRLLVCGGASSVKAACERLSREAELGGGGGGLYYTCGSLRKTLAKKYGYAASRLKHPLEPGVIEGLHDLGISLEALCSGDPWIGL